jgi:hypothetical protein
MGGIKKDTQIHFRISNSIKNILRVYSKKFFYKNMSDMFNDILFKYFENIKNELDDDTKKRFRLLELEYRREQRRLINIERIEHLSKNLFMARVIKDLKKLCFHNKLNPDLKILCEEILNDREKEIDTYENNQNLKNEFARFKKLFFETKIDIYKKYEINEEQEVKQIK